MAVPNSPAGPRSVAAINPTRVGATFDDVANSPDGDFITAINPTSIAAKNVPVASPITQLPAASSKLVNWTPVVAAPRASAIVLPVAAQIAGILDANNEPVAGSGGPLYVQGNVTVGANQVGTSVILTPR